MIGYRLIFMFLIARCLFAMENPGMSQSHGSITLTKSLHNNDQPFCGYSGVVPLKVIAAYKVHECGLLGTEIQQNVYDNIMLEEYKHMPLDMVEEHKKRMLTKIQRNNSIIPCNRRVQERIYTYNAIAYMNKK